MGWKIVRDNDDKVCAPLGVSGQWRVSANPAAGLAKKLLEEVGEYGEAGDPGELYDLRDVLDELIRLRDPGGVCAILHARKVKVRGGFGKHIEWSPVPKRQTIQ